eukprot:1061895-Prorocentrum_minimum.AAC.1
MDRRMGRGARRMDAPPGARRQPRSSPRPVPTRPEHHRHPRATRHLEGTQRGPRGLEGARRGPGGSLEGIYRSSLDA